MNMDKFKVTELGQKQFVCPDHGEYTATGTLFMSNEVWTKCPACEHDEHIEAEQKEREARERRRLQALEQFYIEAGIIRRYRGVTLSNFGANERQDKALGYAQRFIEQFDAMSEKGQNLMFCGDVGTGKTRLVSAMLQTLGKGRYIRAVDISRTIRASYDTREKTELQIIDELVTTPLLVIDEVGVQFGTANEHMVVSDLIDRRYGEMRPTVIVSNLSKAELSQVFGERAWDRLTQNCLICPILGPSQRQTKR